MMHFPKNNSGFSLIQISLLIAVASVLLVASLPGGRLSNDAEKRMLTQTRMQKINDAMRVFMSKNLRRPCPADATLPQSDANFGIESATPGTCTGGSPAANLSTTTVVAGAVPTRSLGLPDEYALDAYNRRLLYAVDKTATDVAACRDAQNLGTKGDIKILSSAGWVTDAEHTAYPNVFDTFLLGQTVAKDYTMWALLSHGKDGAGAWPAQGGSERYTPGSIYNNDTKMNGALNYSGGQLVPDAASFTGDLIQRETYYDNNKETEGFDDQVWYLEPEKNTCCIGKMCNIGFRITGNPANERLTPSAVGDINGDGISDIIFTTTMWPAATGPAYVLFGAQTGWPNPSTALDLTTYLNGTTGFTINNNSAINNFGAVGVSPGSTGGVATGDINGDGYDDILITGIGKWTVVFGKATFAATVNTASLSSASSGFIISGAATSGDFVSMGDINGDGYKDMLFGLVSGGASQGYVIYGKSSGWTVSGSPSTMALATLAAADGFRISTSDTTNAGLENFGKATGDINGDGYDDMVFWSACGAGVGYPCVNVIWGRTTANWNAADVTGTPATFTYSSHYSNVAKAVQLGNSAISIGNVVTEDMNNDGIKDIVVYIYSPSYRMRIYYGKSAGWANPTDINSSGVYVDTATNKPAWVNNPIQPSLGDINGDGRIDMASIDTTADPDSLTDAGSTYVLFQPSTGWANVNLFDKLNGTEGFHVDGVSSVTWPTTGNMTAASLNVADINRDGRNDLLIGSLPVGTQPAYVYVVFGRKTVPWTAAESLYQLY